MHRTHLNNNNNNKTKQNQKYRIEGSEKYSIDSTTTRNTFPWIAYLKYLLGFRTVDNLETSIESSTFPDKSHISQSNALLSTSIQYSETFRFCFCFRVWAPMNTEYTIIYNGRWSLICNGNKYFNYASPKITIVTHFTWLFSSHASLYIVQ